MLKTSGLILILTILTSCSFYSSVGRKQFEEKASTSLQTFSLRSCRNLSAAENWLKDEFPSRSHELIESNTDYEVWGRPLEDHSVEITVFTKIDDHNTESCIYNFESPEAWRDSKAPFLEELSRSLGSID